MIAVVSHDAGGAEVLSSYVRQKNLSCVYVLEGPALKVFERKLGAISTLPLREAIVLSDEVLCGTSWQSDLEFNAIKYARSLGKRCVAFLDHWVHYRERFSMHGETCLPDEIWTGDPIAEDLARSLFSPIPVRGVENPYFKDVSEEIQTYSRSTSSQKGSLSVLYVCEPVREICRSYFGNEWQWGYVEEDAIRFFLKNIWVFGEFVDRIVIRPHPSEPVGKYDWVEDEFALPIVKGGVGSLVREIVDCDVVVGCESMAMVIGLIAKKRVVSSVPPGGKTCSLPHPQIEHLQTLITSGELAI